jgi:hypothetical protein
MNIASEAIIRWLLSRTTDDTDEIGRFVEALRKGVIENDPSADAIINGALARAREEAKGSDDAETIEKLIAMHVKLKALAEAEKTVDALQEIRKIVDQPPVSGTLARARNWGIAAHLKKLAGTAD